MKNSEEKYRWNDLRKDPDDIPYDWSKVIVVDSEGQYFIPQGVNIVTLSNGKKVYINSTWIDTFDFSHLDDCTKIIAWKEIKPFEEYA